MTLEAQYNRFLKDNPDTTFSFNEWMKWHGNEIEQALIKMMQDDEELGLYDYGWCKGNVVLPREEIKLEDVFNDDKREGVKKFIHEVKSIPAEEILANRSNAYDFIDFDKQETLEESQNLKNFKKLVSDEVSPAMKEFIKEKETLEEAAERLLNLNELDSFRDYHYKQDLYNAFMIGIKYQQKNSYSEEEVLKLLINFSDDRTFLKKDIAVKWFEQFKKK